MIPKVIHLTYKDNNIPDYVIPNWESLNPGYTVKFYTDEDCQKYLLENYDVRHLDMFNFLKDGPIKADFFRLCILLKEGGYYCDIDAQPLVSFDSFINPIVNFMTVLSKPSNGLVNPHIIACLPGHKIIEETKNTYFKYLSINIPYSYHKYSIVPIMGNIIYKLLGGKPPVNLRISGPWVICSEYFKVKEGVYNLSTGKTQFIQEYCLKDPHSCYCSYNGIKLVMNRYTDYKDHKYNIKPKIDKKFNKIFQIGFNKCGTTSIHNFFIKNNLNSIHYGNGDLAKQIHSNIKNNKDPLFNYENYDCYTDMEAAGDNIFIYLTYYKILDKKYPDSKFILNIRDVNKWIESRLNHPGYLQTYIKITGLSKNDVIELWKKTWHSHLQEVQDYFKDREDSLLIFNIETEGNKLVEFMSKYMPLEFPVFEHFYKTKKKLL